MTDNRKYDGTHKKIRAELLAVLKPGQLCLQMFSDGSICGQPMYLSQPLDLGHDDAGMRIIGLVHRRCNRRAAAQKANRTRSARSAAVKAARPDPLIKRQHDNRWCKGHPAPCHDNLCW